MMMLKRATMVIAIAVAASLFAIRDPFATPLAVIDALGAERAPTEIAPTPSASGVFVMEKHGRALMPVAATVTAQPPALPFTYFGTITEGGEAVVILQDGARMLKVRGPGPLTDDYVVEAVFERFMWVRYLPLGAQQALELGVRRKDPVPDVLAEDSPQD